MLVDSLDILVPPLVGAAVIIAAGMLLGLAGFIVACLVVAVVIGTTG